MSDRQQDSWPRRRVWPALMAILGASALFMVACGGDEEPTATTAPTEEPTEQPPSGDEATPTEQPTGGDEATATPTVAAPTATEAPVEAPAEPQGTLTVAKSDIAFPAMIPSQMPVNPGSFIHRWSVYETAFAFGTEQPTLQPRLVTEFEADPSGTEWTLKLREGVQFHGDWGEVTAEDFQWSFHDEISEGSIHSSIGLARLLDAQMEVVDKYTVKVTINSPNAFFFDAYFGNGGGAATKVFSKERFDTLGEDEAIVDISGGTGPYRFEQWEQGNEAILQAVSDHYRATPDFQTVRILEIKEASTQLAALETGEVDAGSVPPPSVERIENAGLEAQPFGIPGSQRMYAQGMFCMETTLDGDPVEPYPRPAYDPSKPWIGDCEDSESMENAAKVRRAIAMAIDREAIVDNILGGWGDPEYYLPEVTGPQLARMKEHPKWDDWVIPHDPDKAKALLAEAGYPDGFEALIRITTGSHPLEVETGQAVAQMMSGIGIDVETQVLTYSGNRPSVVARERNDFWMRSASGGGAEPAELVQLRRNPENAFNPGFELAKPLEIIRELDVASSQDEQMEIRGRLYDWFHENMPIIPVVLAQSVIGINPDVIAEWPMSIASSEVSDFENAKRAER